MQLKKVSHFFAEIAASNLQSISIPIVAPQNLSLTVKRDDCLHPIVSGNKWRKLKHLLLDIEAKGYRHLAVMGGAYSNLIHALAYLTYRLGWRLELYVRAYPQQALTPTLKDAVRWGANIHYVNREQFRLFRAQPPTLADDVFWVAEGGFHSLALKGTAETLMELTQEYDYIVTACATGAGIAGLQCGIEMRGLSSQVIGISVLNNSQAVRQEIKEILPKNYRQPTIISGYEFGGYAKCSEKLESFIDNWERTQGIILEPIYSGKSFYGTIDLIGKNFFKPNSKILLIHCGGLQGKRR